MRKNKQCPQHWWRDLNSLKQSSSIIICSLYDILFQKKKLHFNPRNLPFAAKSTISKTVGHYSQGRNFHVSWRNQLLSLKAKHMACDAPIATDKTLWGPNPSSSIKKWTSTGHGWTGGSPGTPNWESLAFPHTYNFPLSVKNKKEYA